MSGFGESGFGKSGFMLGDPHGKPDFVDLIEDYKYFVTKPINGFAYMKDHETPYTIDEFEDEILYSTFVIDTRDSMPYMKADGTPYKKDEIVYYETGEVFINKETNNPYTIDEFIRYFKIENNKTRLVFSPSKTNNDYEKNLNYIEKNLDAELSKKGIKRMKKAGEPYNISISDVVLNELTNFQIEILYPETFGVKFVMYAIKETIKIGDILGVNSENYAHEWTPTYSKNNIGFCLFFETQIGTFYTDFYRFQHVDFREIIFNFMKEFAKIIGISVLNLTCCAVNQTHQGKLKPYYFNILYDDVRWDGNNMISTVMTEDEISNEVYLINYCAYFTNTGTKNPKLIEVINSLLTTIYRPGGGKKYRKISKSKRKIQRSKRRKNRSQKKSNRSLKHRQ